MIKSPFKFLDSYTKEDRGIFFGREREIEELYQRVFESKLMLVYGVSGTGKSSLIHCGLANKFQETDWLPLVIRRGGNIVNSMAGAIQAATITKQEGQFTTPAHFKKAVRSLYLDHYKPIFFIFDQFEELFIFGDKEERKSFVHIIKSLVESDLQCRLIFVMREEYMAGVTEFERYIPTFFANRVRIEKMSHINALEAIKEPCRVADISLEEGFAETLLERLSPGSTEVELTYLQVFLDRILRLATANYPPFRGGLEGVDYHSQGETRLTAEDYPPPGGELKGGYSEQHGSTSFTISLLSQIGNVTDLLGSFLDEQISLLEDSQTGLSILKTFVSLKGTRKQLSEEEIMESSRTFGKEIPTEMLKEYLQQFINLRILKDKNEAGNYELRHDSLADKIYGKITMMEKELLEVMNFLETANQQYEKRGAFLSEDDLKYIQYFEDKQILKKNKEFIGLIELSKKYHSRKKRKRRQIAIAATVSLIIILSTLSIWAVNQRSKAISQKNIAEVQKNEAIVAKQEAQKAKEDADKAREEADVQRTKAEASAKVANEQKYRAENARQIAENELYINIKNSLSVSAEKMNVLYFGIMNPVRIAVSGIPDNKLIAKIDAGEITKGDFLNLKNVFLVKPGKMGQVIVTVYGEIKPGKKDSIGSKTFRVKSIPDPYVSFAGRTGGIILKETALETKELEAKINMDFDLKFSVSSFNVSMTDTGLSVSQKSNSIFLTSEQLSLIQRVKHGEKLYFEKIKVVNPDGWKRDIPPIYFTIYDYRSVIDLRNDVLMHKAAMDFYQEGMNNEIRQREPFLENAFEIFNSMQERKPDDLIDELIVLSESCVDQFQINLPFIKEFEEKIPLIQKQIIDYDWHLVNIDTVFYPENKLMPILSTSPLFDKQFGFHDFLKQLLEKLSKIPDIKQDQREHISNSSIELARYFRTFRQYENSLKACMIAIQADSSNQEAYTILPVIYILNNMYEKAEKIYMEWKDKLWTVGDQNKSFREAFLADIADLGKYGITHPDFAKVRDLLKK